jgi:hypothetical protein
MSERKEITMTKERRPVTPIDPAMAAEIGAKIDKAIEEKAKLLLLDLSLDDILIAIPKLSDPDLKKLREVAMEECTKRKLPITQFEEHPYENPWVHRGRKPK